jgi:hypothetical protein
MFAEKTAFEYMRLQNSIPADKVIAGISSVKVG